MSAISDLVKQRQADLAAREKREASERQTALDSIREQAKVALGDLYDELDQYASFGSYEMTSLAARGRAYLPSGVEWAVKHPDYGAFWVAARVEYHEGIDENDSSLVVKVGEVQLRPRPSMNGGSGSVNVSDRVAVADFFLERFKWMQDEKEKAKAEAIQELTKPFFLHHVSAHTPQHIKELFGKLLEIDPEHTGEHINTYNKWLIKREEWDQDQEKRDEEERQKIAAKEEAAAEKKLLKLARQQAEEFYVWALEWWQGERNRALEMNLETMTDFQLNFDKGEFQLWEMEYAVSGRDEEGIAITDTMTAWVLCGKPDSEGCWPVWDGGAQKIRLTHFFTATTLKYWGFVTPSKNLCYLSIVPKGMPEKLRVNPNMWDRRDELQALVDEAMLPVPPLPDPVLFGLSADRGRNIRDGFFGY